jgi:hypothetical protein
MSLPRAFTPQPQQEPQLPLRQSQLRKVLLSRGPHSSRPPYIIDLRELCSPMSSHQYVYH